MVLKGICFLFLKWTGNRVTFSFTRDPFISAVHHHTLWPAGTFALIFLAAEAVVRASVTILTKNAPLGVGVQVLVGLTWNDSWKLVTRYKLSSCCFVDAGLIGVWLSWLSTLTMYTTYNQTGDFSLCVQYKLRSWRVAGVMIHLSSRHCRDCFSTKAFNPFSWLWHQTESFTLHKRCHLRPTHCLLPAQFVHPKNIILQPQFVPGILDGWPRVGGYKHPYNYQLVWWEHQGTVVVFFGEVVSLPTKIPAIVFREGLQALGVPHRLPHLRGCGAGFHPGLPDHGQLRRGASDHSHGGHGGRGGL